MRSAYVPFSSWIRDVEKLLSTRGTFIREADLFQEGVILPDVCINRGKIKLIKTGRGKEQIVRLAKTEMSSAIISD